MANHVKREPAIRGGDGQTAPFPRASNAGKVFLPSANQCSPRWRLVGFVKFVVRRLKNYLVTDLESGLFLV